MCGVLCIINKNKLGINVKKIKKSMDLIKYRGPDNTECISFHNGKARRENFNGNDYVIYSKLIMAHNRLSIIDLSDDGIQPFVEGDYFIIFNGEIYNYIELKKDLQNLGYEFYTNTDTEVLLKAYMQWGGDVMQNKLNGMWSIVIYNLKTSEIFVSRDRLGVKPLYYFENSDFIFFCSEIKQILPFVQLEENHLHNLSILINNGSGNSLNCSFKNVFKFPAASFLQEKIDSFKFNFKRYWRLSYDKDSVCDRVDEVKLKKYAQDFYEILFDCVKIRLRSDVKVGITLSGGVDSNSIFYLMKQILPDEKINVFSCVFDVDKLSDICEVDNIKLALHDKNCNWHKIVTNYNDLEHFINVYSQKTFVYDEPVPSIGFSGYDVYKTIRDSGVRVLLEGQGADELLVGYYASRYHYFRAFRLYKLWQIDSLMTFKLFLKGLFYNYSSFSIIFLREICKYLYKKRAKNLNIEFTNEIFEYLFERDVLVGNKNSISNLNDSIIYDLNQSLRYLLYTGDRDSMMFSVESRLPFVDYRLIEFVVNLPEGYKLNNDFSKFILRKAFDGKLPNQIIWNKKKLGYPDADFYYVKNNVKLRDLVIRILNNFNKKLDYNAMIDIDYTSVEKILAYLFFRDKFFNQRLKF